MDRRRLISGSGHKSCSIINFTCAGRGPCKGLLRWTAGSRGHCATHEWTPPPRPPAVTTRQTWDCRLQIKPPVVMTTFGNVQFAC